MEKKKKLYIFSIVMILAIIAIIGVWSFQNKKTEIKIPTGMSPELYDKSCSTDSDCVVVNVIHPPEPCCGSCSQEAINKQANAKRGGWRNGKNCSVDEIAKCPFYDCVIPKKESEPICVKNQCEIKWVDKQK